MIHLSYISGHMSHSLIRLSGLLRRNALPFIHFWSYVAFSDKAVRLVATYCDVMIYLSYISGHMSYSLIRLSGLLRRNDSPFIHFWSYVAFSDKDVRLVAT